MLIVSVNYIKPLEQIDSLLEKHIEFLKEQYEKNVFVASGRKVPRTGGIILAKTKNREELDTILQQDHLYKNGAAEYEITEFIPSMALPEYGGLNEVQK